MNLFSPVTAAVAVIAVASVIACTPAADAPAVDVEAMAKNLTQLDDDWSKAAGTKDLERVASFYSEILEQVAATPGVLSAGAISDLPLLGSNTSDNFTIEGRPPVAKQEEPGTEYHVVTPRYFEAMGIPLLAGRDFAGTDTKQAPNVVVINEAFARRHFAGESPLGHRIRLQGQERDPLLIVGVVGDVRQLGLDKQPVPEAFVPFLQDALTKLRTRTPD